MTNGTSQSPLIEQHSRRVLTEVGAYVWPPNLCFSLRGAVMYHATSTKRTSKKKTSLLQGLRLDRL